MGLIVDHFHSGKLNEDTSTLIMGRRKKNKRNRNPNLKGDTTTNIDTINGTSLVHCTVNFTSEGNSEAFGVQHNVHHNDGVVSQHKLEDKHVLAKISKNRGILYVKIFGAVLPIASDDNFLYSRLNFFVEPQIIEIEKETGSARCPVSYNDILERVKGTSSRALFMAVKGGGKQCLLEQLTFDIAKENEKKCRVIPILLNLQCVEKELELESIEKKLVQMFHDSSPFETMEETSDFLKRNSETLIFLFYGFERISVKAQETFKRTLLIQYDSLNRYHFLKTTRMILATEPDECDGRFRANFDNIYVLNGLKADSVVPFVGNLDRRCVRNGFLNKLNALGLSFFLSPETPALIICAFRAFQDLGERTTRYLVMDKTLKLQIRNHLFKYYGKETASTPNVKRILNSLATTVISENDKRCHLVRKKDTQLGEGDFQVAVDLKLILPITPDLFGWRWSAYVDYLTVKYLNSSIKQLAANQTLAVSVQNVTTQFRVVFLIEYVSDRFAMSHLLITRPEKKHGVVPQSSQGTRYQISIVIYDEWMDLLNAYGNYFSIETIKSEDILEETRVEKRATICPITFDDDDLRNMAIKLCSERTSFRFLYPNTEKKHLEPNLFHFNYTFDINGDSLSYCFNLIRNIVSNLEIKSLSS